MSRALPSSEHAGKKVQDIDPITSLLDVSDLTRILKCSRAVGYKLASSGEIPSVLVGEKLVRFHPDDVRDYINARRKGAGG